ncbi:DUF4253 domain-containing protein [Adhaeretor mobilis]|uniref:DUF4253 domain-containing protein n=1 Tax=Adhaeretor mobilis TaxID=1930276 RepID=A0A517N2Q2_9BACT|nr:DUF4253 domain-containing protein [Adhaeretor mobilis]QDT01411.1 hypothetical protein HG15A2_47530 [Adhaeretor mobilis]
MINTEELKSKVTNGDNCDVSNADIIARLEAWDAKYGIAISDIGHDRVTVEFASLPEDTRTLAQEIYEFCPDTVDQGFGCYDEMIEMAEEMGQELDPRVHSLVEGVDLSEENYGVELLARALVRDKAVGLWWD